MLSMAGWKITPGRPAIAIRPGWKMTPGATGHLSNFLRGRSRAIVKGSTFHEAGSFFGGSLRRPTELSSWTGPRGPQLLPDRELQFF
jgi:hypothetical protein